jgi:hypothetical protein
MAIHHSNLAIVPLSFVHNLFHGIRHSEPRGFGERVSVMMTVLSPKNTGSYSLEEQYDFFCREAVYAIQARAPQGD